MAKTVLIVEDNELNMKLFHDLLEAHGYQTVGTRNGIEALDLARKPTLVIHGTRDKMVRRSGGRATARAIPGARLMMVEGMGHDLPEGTWPQLIEAIGSHAKTADGALVAR